MENTILEFIDALKDCIISNTLSERERLLVLEMYTKMCYLDSIDNINTSDADADESSVSDHLILKYLAMGWYIYSELDKSNSPN